MLCPSSYNVSWGESKKGHCPSLSYDEAVNKAGIPTIISYCDDICEVFNAALGNKDNKHNKLLNEGYKVPYSLEIIDTLHFQCRRWTIVRTLSVFDCALSTIK